MPLADCSSEQRQPGAQPKVKRWVIGCARFSVAFAFVVLFVCAVYQIQHGAPKSIKWDRYSEEKRDAAFAAGKTVVVLLYSELAIESELALRTFDFNSATKLCKCSDFEPLVLRHRWEGHDINSIWEQVGHTKYPRVVVYSPNVPPVSYDPLSLQAANTRIAASRYR